MVNISTLASAVAHRLGSDAVVLSVTRLGDILNFVQFLMVYLLLWELINDIWQIAL